MPNSETKQWICKTCDHGLKRGKLPAQAKANNNKVQLEDIPSELSDLNPLKVHFICLRIQFMTMVAFPCGKQRAIHGPTVNVPTDLTPVCTLLTRLPCLIPDGSYEAKEKAVLQGTLHVSVCIRPAKVQCTYCPAVIKIK